MSWSKNMTFADAVGLIFGIVIASFFLSGITMLLWNACLVGAVTFAHPITWLQAWGISLMLNLLSPTKFKELS